jgi:glycosyltransferase involved in cell wall biosynthesis
MPIHSPNPTLTATDLVTTAAPDRPLLLCFSHLRWNFVYQRPQHLMTRAAREYDVLFLEEPIVEDVPRALMRLERAAGGVQVAVPIVPSHLTAAQTTLAQARLLDELLAQVENRRRIFWYYTPMALLFGSHHAADVHVYDNMDELSAFRGASPMLQVLESRLLRRCDLVFCGGQSLYEAKRHRHPSVHAFPSSIDVAHFGRARTALPEPADLAALARPRLGFFGVIDERMDLALVDQLARRRPDWQWIMIGPVVKVDPASLPRHPNLHWLGGRRYDQLPAYLAHWDVGIMPFALNESTRYISPTKTPEFLAAGVPVLSSAIRDVVSTYGERRLVEIATGADEWLEQAEALLTRPRGAWLAEVDRMLANTSWDRTWTAMQQLLLDRLERTPVSHTTLHRPRRRPAPVAGPSAGVASPALATGARHA